MSEPLPFVFYDDINKQNRYKSQCENYSSNELLIQNGCKLLPFQIKSVDLSASAIVVGDLTISLYKASDNSLVQDITPFINVADLELEKNVSYVSGTTTITNSYFTYFGINTILDGGNCVFDSYCEYYIVVSDAASTNVFGTFYSEVFRIAQTGEEFIKITFDNTNDFLGRVLFQNNYSNTIYLDVDIKKPTYPVIDDGSENGNREFIPDFIKWEKRHSFSTYLPEYLIDAMTALPLYDNVNLTFKDDSSPTTIKDILVEVDWQDLGDTDKHNGCFALATVSFAIDNIVITACSDDMTIN